MLQGKYQIPFEEKQGSVQKTALDLSLNRIAKLEDDMPKLLKEFKVPGVSIAIIDDAQVVWKKGFGVKQITSSDEVTVDTVFEAASLSKPLFAYAVLKLFQQKKYSIDTPLNQYFSMPYTAWNFQPSEERLKQVTLRHVLAHLSGFSNWDCWEGPNAGRLKFCPGEKFSYSGEAYIFAQRVIEHIVEEPLAEFIKTQVLDVLKMIHSSYIWLPTYEEKIAAGHGQRNDGLDKKFVEGFSAFSLYTTPSDYAQFLLAMMSNTNANEKSLLDLMLTPQVNLEAFCSWGLGWGLEHTSKGDYFWHWGNMGDSQCFTLASREHRQGIVIMTNSENGLALCELLVQQVFTLQHPCAKKTFLMKLENQG